jgi:hypothetical protein
MVTQGHVTSQPPQSAKLATNVAHPRKSKSKRCPTENMEVDMSAMLAIEHLRILAEESMMRKKKAPTLDQGEDATVAIPGLKLEPESPQPATGSGSPAYSPPDEQEPLAAPPAKSKQVVEKRPATEPGDHRTAETRPPTKTRREPALMRSDSKHSTAKRASDRDCRQSDRPGSPARRFSIASSSG